MSYGIEYKIIGSEILDMSNCVKGFSEPPLTENQTNGSLCLGAGNSGKLNYCKWGNFSLRTAKSVEWSAYLELVVTIIWSVLLTRNYIITK